MRPLDAPGSPAPLHPDHLEHQDEPLPPVAAAQGPAGPGAALLAAVQFLLITPAFIQRTFTDREMGASVGFYPLVGLLLGGLLAGFDALLGLVFPLAVRTTLVLAAWVILTGALHLDGFLDACDGLLGGFTPEKRLAIMRDERVGGYALAGGILLLLLQYSALNALVSEGLAFIPANVYALFDLFTTERFCALLLAPVIGRWGMALAVIAFPYARSSGLGKAIKDHTGPAQTLLASFVAVTVLAAVALAGLLAPGFGPGTVLVGALAALLTWLATTRFALQRLPGLTGDLYGAINLLIETVVLLVFAIQ